MKKGKGKMTSLVWSIVKTLWPFLWEMVVGKKTLKQALRSNKKSVFFVVAFCASIGINVMSAT